MAKNLVFFKTHYINNAVISEYSKLFSSLPDNFECLLFMDNHAKVIDSSDNEHKIVLNINNRRINTFLYDKFVQDELKLPYYTDDPDNTDLGKVMWYCSDYPLYIIRKFYPNYDYYWSFENDVFCNGNSYEPFFNKYLNDDSDLIISHYRNTKNKDWYWIEQTEWCYSQNDIYGCLFPVVRMSHKAIDFLYKKRLKHAIKFQKLITNKKNKKKIRWIFCEAFTATELTNNKFKCKNLDEPYIRWSPTWNLNLERIFENPNFRLYHPVK